MLTNRLSLPYWVLPCATSVLFLAALAVPMSDTPGPAMIIMAVFALTCAVAWIYPAGSTMAFSANKALRLVLWIGGAFLLYLVCQPFLLALVDPTARALYDTGAAAVEYLKLAGIFTCLLLGWRLARASRSGAVFIDALLVVSAIWAVAAIAMYIKDPSAAYGIKRAGGAARLAGAFSSPNSAGTFFAAASVLALARLLGVFYRQRGRPALDRIDWRAALCWILCCAALFLTMSRSALLAGVICSFSIVFILSWRRVSPVLLFVFLGAAAAILALIFFVPAIATFHRMENFGTAASMRSDIFRAHLEAGLTHPVFGRGLGSFITTNNTIVTAEDYSSLWSIRAAHNVYLQWFEDAGLVGLLGLFALNGAILLPIVMAAFFRAEISSRLIGILAGYLVFVMHGLTDYALQEPVLEVFLSLLLGAGLALSADYKKPGHKLKVSDGASAPRDGTKGRDRS